MRSILSELLDRLDEACGVALLDATGVTRVLNSELLDAPVEAPVEATVVLLVSEDTDESISCELLDVLAETPELVSLSAEGTVVLLSKLFNTFVETSTVLLTTNDTDISVSYELPKVVVEASEVVSLDADDIVAAPSELLDTFAEAFVEFEIMGLEDVLETVVDGEISEPELVGHAGERQRHHVASSSHTRSWHLCQTYR